MAALLAAAMPMPALAQAYQCRVPDRITLPTEKRSAGPRLRGAIDGYILAVSWSPEYCRGDRASDPGNYQCNGSIGRFGFVLHGLWPDAANGPSPQWCAPAAPLSPAEIKTNLCMTPVPWLIQHEWAKHGTCMARDPQDYFKVSRILWQSLQLPDADKLSRARYPTAGDLRRAFVARNPGWKREAVGVLVSNGGWLRELYLCYGKDFRPAACDRNASGARDSVPIKIWRGL